MIRLQAVRRQRPDAALAFAERARARTLLEARAGNRGAFPIDPASARTQLAPTVAVVYYAALDDRLLVWTLTRSRLNFHDTPVRHADLMHLVEQFRSEMEIRTIPPRDTPSLARLYDLLIRPVARDLPEDAE